MASTKKVLLGGVPFGTHNIGDEAILEASVALLRQYCSTCTTTVATASSEGALPFPYTATCPLIGFPGHLDRGEIEDQIRRHDCFIWCGATGLSDYPETSLRLLDIAQRMTKQTIVWGVGMNTELNPAMYRVQPGNRQRLLDLIRSLSLGLIDAKAIEERRRVRRVHRKIRECLSKADLVVVRDRETKTLLHGIGVTRSVIVGGDAAVLLDPTPIQSLSLDMKTRSFLASSRRKIGFCVSSQRRITAHRGLVSVLNSLVEQHGYGIVFIPMNVVTDTQVMKELQAELNYPGQTLLLEGVNEPRHVLAVVAGLDAVVSSRLHLLILASNVGVPMVGIARGSKFDNYLRHYDMEPVGTVENCDFDLLEERVVQMAETRLDFAKRAAGIRHNLLNQLHWTAEQVAQIICK